MFDPEERDEPEEDRLPIDRPNSWFWVAWGLGPGVPVAMALLTFLGVSRIPSLSRTGMFCLGLAGQIASFAFWLGLLGLRNGRVRSWAHHAFSGYWLLIMVAFTIGCWFRKPSTVLSLVLAAFASGALVPLLAWIQPSRAPDSTN